MCSCPATLIKPFFLSLLLRTQDCNKSWVSGVKNIEKVKIVLHQRGLSLKTGKETMDKYVSMIMVILCQYSESDL